MVRYKPLYNETEDETKIRGALNREYDKVVQWAGEYICPLSDGVPCTDYEKSTVRYLAQFACYVLRRTRQESTARAMEDV